MTGFTTADIPDLTGRTAIVAGASSGTGLETARALAAHGARVVLGVRDEASGALPALYAAVADLPGDTFAGPSRPASAAAAASPPRAPARGPRATPGRPAASGTSPRS